ncbi:hypothetical protein FDI24_gp037 [Acidovorax phage ACP17]|uniref:Uncharacterized protein n=1 Tax=Acidovorax phage ACP17 TaxID=2010329 RepID=A0A218M3F7_9CAUD|nr:hypothetical protein FDI24_gp037 [Acidovorax phage ACP17]ASD50571.1 hypothetical protein [Acidovorax phage ACP17]
MAHLKTLMVKGSWKHQDEQDACAASLAKKFKAKTFHSARQTFENKPRWAALMFSNPKSYDEAMEAINQMKGLCAMDICEIALHDYQHRFGVLKKSYGMAKAIQKFNEEAIGYVVSEAGVVAIQEAQ